MSLLWIPTLMDGPDIEQHSDDACDECDEAMNMTRTRYDEEGYDYLHWLCSNDDCLSEYSRHEYHSQQPQINEVKNNGKV